MKEKKKRAVAIKYTLDDKAPKVIAKGEGYVASKIIERGNNEGVKLHYNKDLVNELFKIEIGGEIPEELFEVVAKILAFIYEIDKKVI